MDSVKARAPAKAAPLNVRAQGLRLLGDLRGWRRDVRDGLAGSLRPLPAKEVALGLRIEVVVGQGIPGSKRGVVIPDAGDVEVIGIDVLSTQRRTIAIARAAAGHRGSR